ncbi:MAG: hypothetical protein RJQ08_08445 [Salinisphaeraceae bacterium]
MTKTVEVLKITANRPRYYRAGIRLGRDPVLVEVGELDKARLAALESDPALGIQRVQVDADEIAPAGGKAVAPPKTAEELIAMIGQVEDEASLDALAEGETRKTVNKAIEARRAELKAA